VTKTNIRKDSKPSRQAGDDVRVNWRAGGKREDVSGGGWAQEGRI
jgi:hypothetical protein